MALCTGTFETGVHGNNVLTTDAGSATAWQLVGLAGTTTIKYDNTHSYDSLAAKITCDASGNLGWVWWQTAFGTQTDHWGRIYVYLTAAPAAGFALVETRSASTAVARVFIQSATGAIELRDAVPSIVGSMTTPIAFNRWARIEYHFVHSATVGMLEAKLFNTANSTSPTEILTSGANRNTGASADRILFGAGTTTSANYSFWMDNIVAGDTSYPGPADNVIVNTAVNF